LDDIEVGLRINHIIDTIEMQLIPIYEIIVVGGHNHYETRYNVKHISFDESQKWGWITRKKNLVTQNATFDRIVFMHDYIALEDNWYGGFLKYGDDWDICMNIVNNISGGRWVDWLLVHSSGYHVLPPYDHSNRESMYVSGAYWVAKKSFMEQFPLNEGLHWGAGEDMEWSARWMPNHNFKFKMNILSSVRCCKENKVYSVLFLNRSEAESAFNTKNVNEMIKWYIWPDGTNGLNGFSTNNGKPWLVDDK
jgi:hypothetical protein